MVHEFHTKVFYEDTDMAGIVYHANYLRYIERARSTLVEDIGVDQIEMRKNNLVFVVTAMNCRFHSSAKLMDALRVETKCHSFSGVRCAFDQTIFCDTKKVFFAEVSVACATLEGKPIRMPSNIVSGFKQFS